MENLSLIDILIITAYLITIFVIGLLAGRNVKNLNEYAVAKRMYPSLILFATLSASFIGGGFSSGNAAKVFSGGITFALTLFGFSLAIFLISIFLAPKMDNFRNCISVGDIMSTYLGNTGKVIAGILGCILCTGILAAQGGAMGAVFSTYTSLTYTQGVLIGCSIVIIYTAFGGMHAVVVTDVIQFIILIVMIPLSLWIGINEIGGIEALLSKVPTNHTQIFNEDMTPLLFIGLFLSFFIGESLSPPYVQRLLAGKNAKITSKAILYSALLSIPFFIVTGTIGLLALVLNPDLNPNESMPYVLKVILPIGLKGLAIAAVISIVMSSADSFLNGAVICLIRDVIEPVFKNPFKNNIKKELHVARILSLIIGMSSVFMSVAIPNVLDILLFSYQFYAPIIAVPLILTLLGKQYSRSTFIVTTFCSSIIIIFQLFALKDNQNTESIDSVAITTFISICIFFVYHNIEQYITNKKGLYTTPSANLNN